MDEENAPDLFFRGEASMPSIDEVDITDDFMFSYVMRDPALCIALLEYLLPGRKIRQVKYLGEDGSQLDSAQPQTQKMLSGAYDKRSVRLDVYLDDGKTVYNVEMQTTPQRALPMRARLYQAHIDIDQLERGRHFDELRPSYVIFICKFDPFGAGLYRYSFENRCLEDGSLALRDEAYKLFFNTAGVRGDISPQLRSVLRYMNDTRAYPVRETDCDLIKQMERAVAMAKLDDDWRRAYLTYQMKQREAELRGIAIGEERGIAIGEERGAARAQTQSARQMLLEHLPVEQIARFSGLSVEQVNQLRAQMFGQ